MVTTYTDVLSAIQTLLQTNSDITAAEHRQVEETLLNYARDQWLTGDIKEIDCDQAYIAANFESSGPNQGKGIVGGEREGWAICNGNNGTRNRTGRVSVAWGLSGLDTNGNSIAQPVMSTGQSPFIVGGTKTHLLEVNEMPPHSHSIPARTGSTNSGGGGANFPSGANALVATGISGGGGANSVGWNATGNPVSPHNNMQPYIVTLFIQKLPNP